MTWDKPTFVVCQASAGSGKTYTLAATYVALLLSGESYRTILAVTFTNKATAEMKDRILLFLDNIARNIGADADAALATVRSYMTRDREADSAVLRRRAADCYRRMLEDYDNIHISTIDTFLMQLLSGLGQMLDDSSATATVELDIDTLIEEAVDRLLTEHVLSKRGLKSRLETYLEQQMEDEKDWDIRTNLKKIALQLYSERAQQLDTQGDIVFDNEALKVFREHNDWRQAACVVELRRMYEQLAPMMDAKLASTWGKRIERSLNGEIDTKDAFRGPTPLQRGKLTGEMSGMADLCDTCRRAYLNAHISLALVSEMGLMTDIRDAIREILIEQNKVLLAQTATTLYQALKPGDADFILEKAGIRYRHIMLDEFQDTSLLQWNNFRPLLEDILSGGGTVFIVGDVKQSIYRWRNGDWRIMAGLGKDDSQLTNYYGAKSLRRNYRSYSEVVRFNQRLFAYIKDNLTLRTQRSLKEIYDISFEAQHLDDYYLPSKEGGCVRIRSVVYGKDTPWEKQDDVARHIARDMFFTMEQRLCEGAQSRDMMILVRVHSEAETIIDVLREIGEQCPRVTAAGLVSCDSFHLGSSATVRAVIERVRTMDNTIPLPEQIEEAAAAVIAEHGENPIEDSLYLSGLMDTVADFVMREGADTAAFLRYWDDKGKEMAVVAGESDAIRIMTIHSAKGLEAEQVYLPYCDWAMVKERNTLIWDHACRSVDGAEAREMRYLPLPMSKTMEECAYAATYAEEADMQTVDNLNLLYVALTRAAEQLYVWVDSRRSELEENKTAGALLVNAIREEMHEADEWMEAIYGEPSMKLSHVHTSDTAPSGKMEDRCSFRGAEQRLSEWHIGQRTPEFRQSRESTDYLYYGETNAHERSEKIALGTICHSVLEQMLTRQDEERALRQARLDGRITNDDQLTVVRDLIDRAWSNNQMVSWFDGKWELMREVTLLDGTREYRPDRVMIDREAGRTIVVDYKFGEKEAKYAKQVRQYMSILLRMGFPHVEGYIWYAQSGEMETVSEKRE